MFLCRCGLQKWTQYSTYGLTRALCSRITISLFLLVISMAMQASIILALPTAWPHWLILRLFEINTYKSMFSEVQANTSCQYDTQRTHFAKMYFKFGNIELQFLLFWPFIQQNSIIFYITDTSRNINPIVLFSAIGKQANLIYQTLA